MDFTLNKYKELLSALKRSGIPFKLRHDVDKKPQNSLRTAQLEHEMGLTATYYFRIVPCSNEPDIIRQICDLGHEIGYHYEDLTLTNGDIDQAYLSFKEHLDYFRQFYPVTKIAMHGSPRSPFDSKDIWKKYTYKDLGITYEPYLDENYSQTFYLTDTGRRWDGNQVSVRDKIPLYQDIWTNKGWIFHHTDDVINFLCSNAEKPNAILINTHPQRWNSSKIAWAKELIAQNAKNIIKRIIVKN